MSMTIEAMKQALEALCDFDYDKRQSAIAALRAAIEEAAPVYEANEAFGKRQEWWNDKMFEMEAELQRYKKSAAMWRNKAYEASGYPLPWKPDELWQGLTKEEVDSWQLPEQPTVFEFAQFVEAKIREKNG